MSDLDRTALINGLAAEFEKDTGIGFKIDKKNYIEVTQTLVCGAKDLPTDVLLKTKNVAVQFFNSVKANSKKNPEAQLMVPYIEIAIKCIDEVISQKLKSNQ